MFQVALGESDTTVTTEHGSVSLPSDLFKLFTSCEEPTKLTSLISRAKELGYTDGFVRSKVQSLAQPGQYAGSSCIGVLHTSNNGRSLFVQWGTSGEVREKLTRNNKVKE